jgi:hypothetical protein
MATPRKAKKKTTKKLCVLCGGPNDRPVGDVCSKCMGTTSEGARRVAESVRDRIQGTERGGFICPYCRCELSWENIKTSEIEVTIYVREKIYYCPSCRSFLGVSSWHTEG